MVTTVEGSVGAKNRVLLLHSPSGRAEALAAEFERAGYDCADCAISGEWLEFVGQFQPAVVLLTRDIATTVARGIAQALRRIAPPPRIVALSKASSMEPSPTAASLGVDYRLRDDMPPTDVVEYVDQVFRLALGVTAKAPQAPEAGASSPTNDVRSERPTHECVVDELQIERVRESYRRCERLLKPSESERRGQQRHPYDGRLLLSFLDQAGARDEQPAQNVVISVWGRDLTTYGMGFFTAREAAPIEIHDAARCIPLDQVLKPEAHVGVGLPQRDRPLMWLHSRVVHFGPTYEGLYLCGVDFVARDE